MKVLSVIYICDDDIVEDLHHFLFECKTLRGIRQEQLLFEEIETVIQSFYPILRFQSYRPFKSCGDFCLSFSFNSELGFLLDQFSKKTNYVK